MTFPILAATLFVIGVAFFAAASRAIFWDRYLKAAVQILFGLCFLAAGVGAGFVAVTLAAYHRLTGEDHVANLNFVRKGDREFTAMFTYPGPNLQVFDLRGDDWQVDARVLKWSGPANLLGFSTLYRLDRISGRYTKIEDEKALPRTVHEIRPPDLIDTWQLARDHKEWVMPWIDAVYGSATYLPMVDGAVYEVRIAPTGLIARPLNDVARKAVSGWK
jgi:hypothetical protein